MKSQIDKIKSRRAAVSRLLRTALAAACLLAAAAPLRCAEMEVIDRLVVNGVSIFKTSATVTGKDAATGYSLLLSSGINMTAGTVNAGLFSGSGLALTGVDLLTANQNISGIKTFTSSITVTAALGIGVLKTVYGANRELSPATAVQYGGIYSSTHVYVDGNVYGTKYYGDGSALNGVTGSDDLGDHVATTTLNMANFPIMNASSAAINGSGVTGANALLQVAGSTMAVLNNGNVGIGVNQPTARLQVQGYSSGNYTVYASTSSTTGVYSVAISSQGATNIKNLVIENRSSDPPSPDRGQIWLIAY